MSERVLYEWRFAGYVCRIVESEPGIVHFEQAQGPPIGQEATGPLAFNRTEKPIGCASEIIHLSQALAEANIINRDLSKAIQGWQEDRNRRESELAHLTARIAELEAEVAVLSGTACAEEQAEGNGPCGACRTCRNKRLAELEAENAKLRACLKAADVIRRPQFLGDDWMVKQRWHAALDTYDRVRAEVDNG